jgi:large conductance mechanosensitive channel
MISSDLVKAIVNDLIMPLIGVILPNNDWQSFVLALGPLKLALGHFMSVFINFLLILLVVYLIIRWLMKLNLVES